MRIAILGATSQIARDYTRALLLQGAYDLTLFGRRPEAISQWLRSAGHPTGAVVHALDDFSNTQKFDAIVNFIGAGDPGALIAMGVSIFDVTYQFDKMVLDYLKIHKKCRYVFLSSGAVYGSEFAFPVRDDSRSSIAINAINAQDWYGVSKLHAECRHRAMSDYSITDIRVFSYFSRSQKSDGKFFMSNVIRAIQENLVLRVSRDPMVRDYICPMDFARLLENVLGGPFGNMALDCYSREPVSKDVLLEFMRQNFGLRYEVVDVAGINATGSKMNYYSLNRRASNIGFQPIYSSLEGIEVEAAAILRAI